MEKMVSAADANRNFSQLLHGVRRGRIYVVTNHGKPIAKLSPIIEDTGDAGASARESACQIAEPENGADRPMEARRSLRGCKVRVALDTNVLAYAEGVNGLAMKKAALELVDKLPQALVVLPVQALGELFQLLVRKADRLPAEARQAILGWRNAFSLIETSPNVLLAALDLTVRQFSIWDAIILCASAEADCHLLLSEDMQDGFVLEGSHDRESFREAEAPTARSALLSGRP